MSNDEQLKTSVLAELKWEPSISSAHIGVTAEDGTITLTGHVETYGQKRAAELATGRVKGVKAIAEEIEVRLPFTVKHDDTQIAKAAAERLRWDAETPQDTVKVKVEKGWITLSGTVDWHFQKDAAEREIRGLSGVVGVFNQITIKPRVNVAHVGEDIRHALYRGWFNPDTIQVTEHDGKVKLTGTVETWQDRETAGATAWAAPGANAVENDVVVAW
ncbi:BON domain-containing protein [Sphingomonas sp. PAMC 26617]|uniref:BON domain-containing protein n=1 Tax=Sphingomonas sp. PAMC 26617 TaxID=1112216 RepID=UPI0002896412|nr:BON domain-containing protein [Sphingomonas sp. PAMC 26617]